MDRLIIDGHEVRECRWCGELKPIEQYRFYLPKKKFKNVDMDGKGRYRHCLDCEAMNSRYKKARKELLVNPNLTKERRERFENTVATIEEIYSLWRSLGYSPPRPLETIPKPIDDGKTLEKAKALVAKKQQISQEASVSTNALSIPDELFMWLEEPLHKLPEYYDDIYEKLMKKYRPILSYDDETALPIYEDTYKDILNKICQRFWDYEEDYGN